MNEQNHHHNKVESIYNVIIRRYIYTLFLFTLLLFKLIRFTLEALLLYLYF